MLREHSINNHGAQTWSAAGLPLGDFSQPDHWKAVFSLMALRHFNCVLESTKDLPSAQYAFLPGRVDDLEPVLVATTRERLQTTSSSAVLQRWAAAPE